MSELVEIRWHGRGGQGAKTAALLLADVAFNIGKHVQGFPEYGPERMGAPITAYDRISDQEIRVHSNIYEPNYVAVVDETLLHTVDVTRGIKKGGAILINTERSSEELMPELNGYEGRIYTIDAKKICDCTLGQYFPNTPMLAAIVKITGIMEPDRFLEEMKKSLQHKFARKPEVLEGNMKALKMALEEVRSNSKTGCSQN
ncbi:MAG: 2-oxoacid:acceptor oxidoreductase family protein [Lachnospiraceae bacterium]|nr:2-oxoacid:acceptor oxidoreductase family protein [Lachnospiraceae bacterium]